MNRNISYLVLILNITFTFLIGQSTEDEDTIASYIEETKESANQSFHDLYIMFDQ